MKILLLLADQHGVGFQRGLMPYHWLARLHGHDIVAAPGVPLGPATAGQEPHRFTPERGMYEWDLVVAQIARDPDAEAFLIEYKKRGGRIIYEIDDSYRNIPVGNPARMAVGMDMIERIERTMSIADALTVTTEYLADHYRKHQPNVFVCRNALDPNQYGPLLDTGEPFPDGTIRIGWCGSQGHQRDIEAMVRPITRWLKARPQARFILGGADWRMMWPRTVHHQLGYAGSTFDVDTSDPKKRKVKLQYGPGERTPAERYPEFLHKLNLHGAIAPIQPTDWNACKSELKLLEYGAVGYPAIASDWGPYRAYYDRAMQRDDLPGPVCILVKTEDEWVQALCDLTDDVGLRDTLRRANRHFVLTEHLIHHRLHEWLAAIDSATEGATFSVTAAERVTKLKAMMSEPRVFGEVAA